MGSTNDLDHVTEVRNTASVTSPSGYLGETGEVAWMDRAFEESERSGHDACASVVESLSSQEATDTTPEVHELMGSSQPKTQGTLLARPYEKKKKKKKRDSKENNLTFTRLYIR